MKSSILKISIALIKWRINIPKHFNQISRFECISPYCDEGDQTKEKTEDNLLTASAWGKLISVSTATASTFLKPFMMLWGRDACVQYEIARETHATLATPLLNLARSCSSEEVVGSNCCLINWINILWFILLRKLGI